MSLIGGGCPMSYIGGSSIGPTISPSAKNFTPSTSSATSSTTSHYHGNGTTPTKRVVIGGNSDKLSNGKSPSFGLSKSSSEEERNDGLLPVPSVVLYSADKIRLAWDRSIQFRHPVGLINAGNSCFLNSVLQCLTYTPPLANYFMQNGHTRDSACPEFCVLCTLQRHVRLCFTCNYNYFRPNAILDNLPAIARHMERFRQEDAHDFLRCLTDTLQKRLLYGHHKLDRFSRETTVINQIFGGYLRSQVVCQNCSAVSNTYEPFLDLSLEVKDVTTLQGALQHFCSTEILDSDNAYSCDRCKLKVRAKKCFTIHSAPNVLTVQLKRYAAGGANIKLNRHTAFPLSLDLGPYLSLETNSGHAWYDLYGVLVHYGMTTTSGHYYCCVLAPNNRWFKLNDATVTSISREEVLRQEAYMLFYLRNNSRTTASNNSQFNRFSGTPSPSVAPRPATPQPRPVGSTPATIGPRLAGPTATNIGPRAVGPSPTVIGPRAVNPGPAGFVPRIVATGPRPLLSVDPRTMSAAGTGQKTPVPFITKPVVTLKHTATASKLVIPTTSTASATTLTHSTTPSASQATASPLKPVVDRPKVSFSVLSAGVRRINTVSRSSSASSVPEPSASSTSQTSSSQQPAVAVSKLGPLVPYDEDEDDEETEKVASMPDIAQIGEQVENVGMVDGVRTDLSRTDAEQSISSTAEASVSSNSLPSLLPDSLSTQSFSSTFLPSSLSPLPDLSLPPQTISPPSPNLPPDIPIPLPLKAESPIPVPVLMEKNVELSRLLEQNISDTAESLDGSHQDQRLKDPVDDVAGHLKRRQEDQLGDRKSRKRSLEVDSSGDGSKRHRKHRRHSKQRHDSGSSDDSEMEYVWVEKTCGDQGDQPAPRSDHDYNKQPRPSTPPTLSQSWHSPTYHHRSSNHSSHHARSLSSRHRDRDSKSRDRHHHGNRSRHHSRSRDDSRSRGRHREQQRHHHTSSSRRSRSRERRY